MLDKKRIVTPTVTTLLEQFKHREVRDLAWVIASPPLVSGELNNTHWWSHDDCLQEFNDCLPQLVKLDDEPDVLINYLAKLKNHRLGSIFEGLVSFWLKISPNYRELKQNIQIIEDKHTYGEIDFIIEKISSKKIIHLEVAVKFYLGCKPYENAYRWFGTNTKDQLGKKIDHLKNHQTQLSEKHSRYLKNYFPDEIDEKHCFIKGRLFYPESSNTPPQNLALTKSHLRGRWRYLNEKSTANAIIKINKSHWLADLNSNDINSMNKASDEVISSIDRAECFVEIEEKDNKVSEKQRVFYLPNNFQFPK